MKTFLHLILCCVALGSLSAREPYHARCERVLNPGKQTEVQREVRAYMDLVIFPRVSLSHVPFADAVEWVQKRIRSHAQVPDPADRVGISMFLRKRQGVQEFVSISLRSATLPQVLDAICQRHRYVWCVEPMTLSIKPREPQHPVAYPVPSAQQQL